MHATPPTPTLPATELRLVTFGSSKTILGVDQQYHWVGTGRVALRYVSPCPPLDPYVRLSPHTAHDRGILWERSISPAPRCILHGQLCAFAGYLCTVSRPSPSGPSPSVLVLVCPAFLGSDYYAPFDCLQGLGAFRSEERRVGKECRSRWSPY